MTSKLIGIPEANVSYDRRTGRYRSGDGRFVNRSEILKLVDSEAARLKVRLKAHARNLTNGNIDLPLFQQRMATDIKLSSLRSTILGAGGKSQATSAQYGSTGRLLRDQYQFLDGFSRDIANGKLTKSQIIARASLYGASTRSAFHQSEKIARGREGFKLAKRVLDASSQHCASCLRHSTGDRFVPIKQITSPGVDCECRSRCNCFVVYRKRPQNKGI